MTHLFLLSRLVELLPCSTFCSPSFFLGPWHWLVFACFFYFCSRSLRLLATASYPSYTTQDTSEGSCLLRVCTYFLSYLLGLCPYLSQGAHERLQVKSYVLFIWTLSCSPETRNLASTILLGLNLVSGQCSSLVIRVTSVEHLVI
jgi:hypothetical protein